MKKKICFFEINKINPSMIIEDILIFSNKELEKIKDKIAFSKYSLSQAEIEDLIDFYAIIETKVELIKEQNNLIEVLYSTFEPLREEFVKKETKKAKQKKMKNIPYMEYTFVEYVLEILKEVHKSEVFETNFTLEEIEKIQKSQAEYKTEKKKLVEKLDQRSKFSTVDHFGINSAKINPKTFNYGKNTGSTFKFF